MSAQQGTPLWDDGPRHTWERDIAGMDDGPVTVPMGGGDCVSTTVDALDRDGVVRINGALSQHSVRALLMHVNAALVTALQAARGDLAYDVGDLLPAYFGNVLCRTSRYDLKLELTPTVAAAVAELLQAIEPTVSEHLGPDAELYELAALISDPRSPRQPVHPDTPFREGEGAAVLTAFVALQPISERMGPTSFLPRTHSSTVHAAFNSNAAGPRSELLSVWPVWPGLLGSGDVTLFDSRLLHCGGANESPTRRVLFYVSFRAKHARGADGGGTLLSALRRASHSLRDHRSWLSVR